MIASIGYPWLNDWIELFFLSVSAVAIFLIIMSFIETFVFTPAAEKEQHRQEWLVEKERLVAELESRLRGKR